MASGTVRVALLLMALFVVILGCQATAPTINKAAKLKEMPPDELPERLMPMGRGKGGKGRDKLPLTVTEVNEGNIEQILRRNMVLLLAMMPNEHDRDARDNVRTLSQHLLSGNGIVLGQTTDPALRKRFKVKQMPVLLTIGNGGGYVEEVKLDDEFNVDTFSSHMAEVMKQLSTPVVSLMTPHHRTRMSKDEAMMLVLLNFTEEGGKQWQNYFFRRFEAIAEKRPAEEIPIKFVLINVVEYRDMAIRFRDAITGTVPVPTLALQYRNATYKYGGESFSLEGINDWLERWKLGLLKPYRRTGAVVDNKPGALYTLTTENFEDVTGDWSKDVLVLFYGPTCPYSKEFLDYEMPKLLEMVDHVPSLIIAKIDCSENECPKQTLVTAYPTFALYKGCRKTEKKGKPVTYWDYREADNLFRWLKQNSYYSIPFKKPPQPDGTRSQDPIIAAAEQVGGEIDPLAGSTNLVM